MAFFDSFEYPKFFWLDSKKVNSTSIANWLLSMSTNSNGWWRRGHNWSNLWKADTFDVKETDLNFHRKKELNIFNGLPTDLEIYKVMLILIM